MQIPLKGRKTQGWITSELDDSVDLDYEIKPVSKFESYGPPEDILKLADWAAHRWVGRRVAFYRASSPNKKIKKLPEPAPPYTWPSFEKPSTIFSQAISSQASGNKKRSVLRLPPIFDIWEVIEEALQFNPLIITPFPKQAREIAGRLASLSLPVACLPDEWAKARAGGSITEAEKITAGGIIVVGTRPAIFAPILNPGLILVIDEHDESLISPQSPTYNTVEVAQKRASDLNIPCVLTSSIPSQEALATSKLFMLEKKEEKAGWPKIEVVDCTDPERQMEGLLTEPLLWQLRNKKQKVICILNRKGRIRLLACKKCTQLVMCKRCGSALQQSQPEKLTCIKCQLDRVSSCRHCGSHELKQLRVGVSKLRENLEVLLKEPVDELTAEGRQNLEGAKTDIGKNIAEKNQARKNQARILVATTAALYGDFSPDVIAFLDFDQQLLAPHLRAHELAFANLTRAGALLNDSSKLLLIQTRMPEHSVIKSATKNDPSILSAEEASLRKELGFPPVKAVAEIARSGADEFIVSLKANNLKSANLKSTNTTLEILGPIEERYLVRADTIEELSNALNNVPRPAKKELRIAVNPAHF